MSHNPIHDAIKKIVTPMIDSAAKDTEGIIISCNYEEQTVDVFWKNPQNMNENYSYNLPLPKDGDGVFRQSVKNGDNVRIAFRNGSYKQPYISTITKSQGNRNSTKAKYGAGIPKGMGYL